MRVGTRAKGSLDVGVREFEKEAYGTMAQVGEKDCRRRRREVEGL